MTYELRLERLFDAPPELVFDTLVDPEAQEEMYTDAPQPGWRLLDFELDLRVGGTMRIVQGPPEGEPYTITYTFREIDRPRRLVSTMAMRYPGSDVPEESTVSMTLEEQGGKTLLTLVQSGFPTEELRDAYLNGAPGFLDALQQAVAARSGR